MLKDFGRLKKTHFAIQSNPIKEVYIIIRFVRLKNMSYSVSDNKSLRATKDRNFFCFSFAVAGTPRMLAAHM